MTKIIGLITARGGSKAIPRKNIKLLAGRPMIAWTIEAALQSRNLCRVIVSTDDEETVQISRTWGAEVPFIRPSRLAEDDSPHMLTVEHAIQWLEEHNNERPDYLMLLQPTSPLRTTEDIDAASQIAIERNAISVVSVCRTSHHPYLSKEIMEDGTLADFMPADVAYLRRQDLPPAYVLNGAIYLARRESILDNHTFLPAGVYAYIMPPERSLDVDSPWDSYLADLILRDKYGLTASY
jgi:CMP-N,N'-diacetyllegionaminic acid synthase